MKKITISLLFVFVMFLGLSLTIKAETGLSYTKISETNPVSISEGVSYKKIVAKSSTDDGTVGNQSVNVTTFAPNSVHFVSWATLKESTVKTTNILEAIKDYETMYPEMMVVAAINDDYFDINDTGNMINPCVREGIIINDTAEEWFYGMGLKDDGSYKLTKKGGEVISSNDETALLKIYDSSNINVLRTITVSVGSLPTDGQTSIIYGATTISTDAAYFSITPSNNVKIGSVRYYKGGVHSYNATGATIITKDEKVARLLDANPTVEIGVTPTGDWAGFNTIIGIGSQFLKDGEVLNYDEIGDQGEEYIGTWCPRTTIGIKENGTVVFMTIDGRQSTKQMDGVTLRENALALIEEGCVQGFNLDGGGSTTMAVLLDGQMTVVNSPSDGSLRHDADFVLAVVPRVQISLTSTSSVINDKAMIMGSFAISKLNGFTFDASEVYLNGKATGQTAEGFIFNDLEQGMNYNLAVYLTYKVGAASYTRPFGSVNVVTGGENTITKQAPSNPQMSFEKTSNGFNGLITFDDPTSSITNVVVKNGTTSIKVYPTSSGYQIRIVASIDKTYNFSVSYKYRINLTEVYDVTLTESFSYEFKKAEEVSYTYRFMDGETVLKEETAPSGSQIVAPTDPVKEGYKFTGWDKEVGLLTADITFNAVFEKNNETQDDESSSNKGSGFNCNFGSALLLSTIALGSVIYILRKKK